VVKKIIEKLPTGSFLFLTAVVEKGVGKTPIFPWRKVGYSRWKTVGFQRAGGDHSGQNVKKIPFGGFFVYHHA
jgi:hypothetical protein